MFRFIQYKNYSIGVRLCLLMCMVLFFAAPVFLSASVRVSAEEGTEAVAVSKAGPPGSSAVNPVEGDKDQLVITPEGLHYSYYDGGNAEHTWMILGKDLYYFDENGIAYHDAVEVIDDKAYYFNSNSICEFGNVLIGDNRYFFTPAVGMNYGFVKELNELNDVSAMYYCDEQNNGAIATGWFEVNTNVYYGDPETGMIQTGLCAVGDKYFGFDEDGVRLVGWNQIEDEWYFFDPENDCEMATDRLIHFTPYDCMRYVKEDGRIAQNETVYINGIDRHFGTLESVRPTFRNNIINNIEYLVAFLVSILFIAAGSKFSTRAIKNLFYALGILTLVLLAGFRSYAVGYDISIYVIPVQNTILNKGVPLSELLVNRLSIEEPLFLLLHYVTVIIFHNSHVFLGIVSFLICGFVFLGIRNLFREENYWLPWLAFCLLFYNASLDLLRQMIAVAMVFYLFSDFRKLNIKRLVPIALVATGFHYSALIVVPAYVISKVMQSEKVNKYVKYILAVLVLLVPVILPLITSPLISFLVGHDLLDKKYNVFIFNFREDSLFSFDPENLFITCFCVFICALYVLLERFYSKRFRRRRKTDAENKSTGLILQRSNVFNIFIALLDLIYASTGSLFNIRFQYYVSIFKVRYLSAYSESRLSKPVKIALSVLVIAGLLFYWYYANIIKKAHSTVPFEFCF